MLTGFKSILVLIITTIIARTKHFCYLNYFNFDTGKKTKKEYVFWKKVLSKCTARYFPRKLSRPTFQPHQLKSMNIEKRCKSTTMV